MILFLYNVALLFALFLSLPLWLVRPRWRAGLRERLGAGGARVARVMAGHQRVWVHAVSVGEVVAMTRLVEMLDDRLGPGAVVISTTTRTGQALARQRFGAERCFYFPLDLPWVVRGVVRALRPGVIVLAESELWPNVLADCARHRIPVAVVNARVSDRSLPRYVRLRGLWRPFLEKLTLVLAQSEEDARRFARIGVPPGRVRVGGNLKFDARVGVAAPLVARLKSVLRAEARVLVAGSTLEDEERLLLEAWPRIVAQVPQAVLVLAPRHPERFARVAAMAHELGMNAIRRSTWEGGALPAGSLFLLDSIGELGSLYGLATLAFVGGSLVPAGGHNPLEPASLGVGVVMGPSYENFRDVVELLREAGGLRLTTRAELATDLAALLGDATTAAAMGERGKIVLAQQAGATARTAEAVIRLLVEGTA